jgi:hypothetical protein
MHTFDERFGITLYVKKDRTPTGTYEPLGWPCFGSGRNTQFGGEHRERPIAEIAGEQGSRRQFLLRVSAPLRSLR